MAERRQEGGHNPQRFVEEVDFSEIEHIEVVGKGAFGTVYKAFWRNQFVAVKYIEQESERNAFTIEVRQLSRVAHENIVALYGACTKRPNVCLVMEYAEGGSLYNVLHCNPKPYYTAAHAMSWAKQCADGVAYLHAMRPKPLIHRDLKPPNLLLVNNGRVLKICDFGTVTDKATLMTNNKGSAAWMAPEVFEGSTYTEKCDVFSWGIILWEVLSREQPFKNIELAFGIMWSVHKGHRPPLLEGCPKPIETLMTTCWDPAPANRPSMEDVVKVMTALCVLFPGAEQPLEYYEGDDIDQIEYDESNADTIDTNQSFYDSGRQSQMAISLSSRPNTATPTNNLIHVPEIRQQSLNRDPIEQFSRLWATTAAPATATTPTRNIASFTNNTTAHSQNRNDTISSINNNLVINNRNNNNHFNRLNPLNGPTTPLSIEVDPNAWELSPDEIEAEVQKSNRNIPNSQGNERLTTTETRTSTVSSLGGVNSSNTVTNSSTVTREAFKTEKITTTTSTAPKEETDEEDSFDSMHLMLEPHLRPVPPSPNSPFSIEVYEMHKKLAKEYLKVQTEIAYKDKHREELLGTLDPPQRKECEDYCRKMEEYEQLLKLQSNLKRQLQLIRSNTRPPPIKPNDQYRPPGPPPPGGGINHPAPQGFSVRPTDDGWWYVSNTGTQS